MLGEYEPGNSPACRKCDPGTRHDCGYLYSTTCAELVAGNRLSILAAETAGAIAKAFPNPLERKAAASSAADWLEDIISDAVGDEWFDASEFMAACGVHVARVGAA